MDYTDNTNTENMKTYNHSVCEEDNSKFWDRLHGYCGQTTVTVHVSKTRRKPDCSNLQGISFSSMSQFYSILLRIKLFCSGTTGDHQQKFVCTTLND